MTPSAIAPGRPVFFLYIASVTLSFLGSGIQNICVPWILLELTHSPTAVGMMLVARGMVIVFLLPHAGALSDRSGRRALAANRSAHFLP